MILSGKDISIRFQQELAEQVKTVFAGKNPYVAVIFLGDNPGSAIYVKNKKKYGELVGLPVVVFGQNHLPEYDKTQVKSDEDVVIYVNQTYDTIFKVMELIDYLNYDADCVGILIQMPLPQQFEEYKEKMVAAITPEKDVDGLGGVILGISEIGLIDFVPATPRAVLYLLEQYELADLRGKLVTIIGQSNIVGKPLALECIKRGSTVYSCNIDTPIKKIKAICKYSDYIISCTGTVHLVDSTFIRDDQTQIIVDVGYGHIDGKPVGDVKIEEIADKVSAYTPVPGGVGPLTVACIFANVLTLQSYAEVLKPYKL
ncbi:MAG: bifunctional 5,10-methylenetetrahydrofolate dehydrogenase/5,10-methenyltetrahydrofolate cyclohydrolase [candidate division SR1 bacterium]|nr:bifunctional 5,10-methylenetetrahydrofolate dehydrogenase/5,10-methenyltetrahydrofolate cyclohydrolase [candidate division SR1 bacterium]